MDVIICFMLIIIFLLLLYNNFYRIEGMQSDGECSLGGFKKLSPEKVDALLGDERRQYECQLKKYNAKNEDPMYLKILIRKTKKMLPVINKPIDNINKQFEDVKNTYSKWQQTKVKRKESIESLKAFVNDEKKKDNESGCGLFPFLCKKKCTDDAKKCAVKEKIKKDFNLPFQF